MRSLYYVADPMCSWCWGFAPVIEHVRAALPSDVPYRLVLGGLAPDCDEPMPAAMRRYVQSAWDAVEKTTGARFNRAFWTDCEPRRSTWPACRAVLAARAIAASSDGLADADEMMFHAIQTAYYRDARNPSDRSTLVALAAEIGLDASAFAVELDSPQNRRSLDSDLQTRDRLGVAAFPTLCFEDENGVHELARGHSTAQLVCAALEDRLRSAS